MEYDLYDVVNRQEQEVAKLRGQIQRGEATEQECLLVQVEFQKEIDRILVMNAKFDY